MTPTVSTIDVEVRYAETDQMGVVHHAAYLIWFELARTRLCEAAGTSYASIEESGHWLMVTGAELSYRRGARYGDTVQVDCWIERLGSRGLSFAYRVRRGDQSLVTGRTDHHWVRVADRRPCRIPAPLEEPFRELAGGAG